MNKLTFFITYGMTWIYISQAAVPINQFWIKSIECEKNLPLFDCYAQVKRINKTAQVLSGYFQLNQPIWTNISSRMNIEYMDYSGVWKGLILRNFHKICECMDRFKMQKRKYAPEIEDGCPMKPGNYTVGPRVINRYRKDWEPDMQFWIPPFFMEADVWRVTQSLYYKDDPKTIISRASMEYRLFNEFMSQ